MGDQPLELIDRARQFLALAAISCPEADVCSVEAKTCSVVADDCSVTDATAMFSRP